MIFPLALVWLRKRVCTGVYYLLKHAVFPTHNPSQRYVLEPFLMEQRLTRNFLVPHYICETTLAGFCQLISRVFLTQPATVSSAYLALVCALVSQET